MTGRLLCLLFVCLAIGASGQVLWLEDFEGEANGATSGTASGTIGGTWTATNPGGGTFSKQNPLGFNVFLVNGNPTEGVWTMAPISIAGTGRAIIETTVVGFLTGAGDYVRLYYKVDGGPEILFFEQAGTIASFTLTGTAIVTGSTLQVVVRATTNGDFFGLDSYTMDDVRITGVNTLYSRKSGDWSDVTVGNSTWSTVALGGASCNCAPIATDYLIIGNSNTVDMSASVTAGGIEIRNTGSLRFNANTIDLNIDRGILQVDAGGSINRNGRTAVQIDFDRGVVTSFTNNGTITSENMRVTAALTTLNITGSGSISLTGDFSIIEDDITVDNNLTGAFTIGDDLIFDQPADIGTDDATFVNRQTLTVTSDILVGANNDDGNTFTNAAGATLNVVSINPADADFNVNNSGTIQQSGDFINIVAAANFNNLATGIWNWNFVQAAFDAQMTSALDCSVSGNTFNYGAAGNQNIVAVSYHHLTLSNSGTKVTTANLDVNGNLLISGTARLDPNTGNDNITLAGNWTVTSTNADPFDEGTELVTLDGTLTAQAISTVLAGGETFYNLTTNNTFPTAPQITLSSNISAANILTMTSGIINLNGLTLSITSNAAGSLVYTAGWMYGGSMARAMANAGIILGNVRGQYPMGTLANYRPFFLGKPGGTGNGTTTVTHNGTLNTTSTVAFTDDLPITRRHDSFWTTTSTYSGAATTWSLRGGGTGFGTIANINHLRLSTSTGVVGTPGTNSGTTASPIVERTTLSIDQIKANNFHIASVDAVNSPLPIHLVSFSAVPDRGRVQLNWKTESELNNDFYTLERTASIEVFEALAVVEGRGTTAEATSYQYLDASPISGVSYYRLKQTDFNGTFGYSPIVKVNLDAAATVSVFPNPMLDYRMNVRATGLHPSEQVEIQLRDITGKSVAVYPTWADTSGTIQAALEVPGAASGIYVLHFVSSTIRSVERIVIP